VIKVYGTSKRVLITSCMTVRYGDIEAEKTLIIMGFSKSDMLFMTRLLNCLHYQVGYNKLLKDGIASYQVVSLLEWEKVRADLRLPKGKHEFYYIYMLRNPLDAIRLNLYEEETYNFFMEVFPEYKNVKKCLSLIAEIWIRWSAMAEVMFPLDFVGHMENIAEPINVLTLSNALGMHDESKLKKAFKRIRKIKDEFDNQEIENFKRSDKTELGKYLLNGISMEDIEREDIAIARNLIVGANYYGYTIR
jgi:hypothetical protein